MCRLIGSDFVSYLEGSVNEKRDELVEGTPPDPVVCANMSSSVCGVFFSISTFDSSSASYFLKSLRCQLFDLSVATVRAPIRGVRVYSVNCTTAHFREVHIHESDRFCWAITQIGHFHIHLSRVVRVRILSTDSGRQ